jgi:nucleotide-binding universal stress UspA family protein
MPPHIVVGVDGSPDGKEALRWAAAQAERAGMDLRIVTAFGEEHQYIDNREAQRLMESVITQASGEALKVAPGLIITHAEHRGSPRRALVDESDGARLLVLGCRGMGGFAGLLLGSVSRGCVHRSWCPVVVVRSPDETGAHGLSDERRIVVGVDGSDSSNAALLWAGQQAEITGATLEAITTWDWVENYGWGVAVPAVPDPSASSEHMLARAIEPVRRTFPGITIEPVAIQGAAAEVLVKASVGADLLVVGGRGHSELIGMLLGSVSEHCATHAHCPVLVMRGAGG